MDNKTTNRAKLKKINTNIIFLSILLLGSILTYYPHFRYKFPLHVDEWFHIAVAKNIARGNWFANPFVPSVPMENQLEKLWHISLSIFELLFKPSIHQWTILPTIIHLVGIAAVFYFTQLLFGTGGGLLSAFLVALLPSNVTILGPVFLAPLNFSMIFLPLSLVFAFELSTLNPKYNYLFLSSVLIFALYLHPPTAMIIVAILMIYAALNLRHEYKKTKNLVTLIIVSFLISLPNYLTQIKLLRSDLITFNFWILLKEIPFVYGVIPTLFFILGVYTLSQSRSLEVWCLLLSSILLISFIVLYARSSVNFLIPYERTFLSLFILMSIISSRGYLKLLTINNRIRHLGSFLLLISLFFTGFYAIERNLTTDYYQLIDKDDYQSFLWIKDNIPDDAIVLIDPWKARALPAISGKKVYSVIPFKPNPESEQKNYEVYRFFLEGCVNSSFLFMNHISVIYSPESCKNQELIRLNNRVYYYDLRDALQKVS